MITNFGICFTLLKSRVSDNLILQVLTIRSTILCSYAVQQMKIFMSLILIQG
jgi:hypothetical protein